jgi:transcriptional regulator with XRE-family HTH domain
MKIMVILEAMTDEHEHLAEMGKLLRERRDELGLSRAEIARRSEVTPTYIYLIEQARSPKGRNPYKPRSDVLLRWAGALELDQTEANHVLSLAGYEPVTAGDAWYEVVKSRSSGDTTDDASPGFHASLAQSRRGPTKKQMAQQRSELLDQVRELLHDAEEHGKWEAVAGQLQALLEFVRFQSNKES